LGDCGEHLLPAWIGRRAFCWSAFRFGDIQRFSQYWDEWLKKFSPRSGASLLAVTLATGLLLGGQPAAAQDAAAIQAIQKQIQQLQAELRKLQADAAKRDAALKRAQAQAKQAQDEAAAARAAAAAAQQAPAASPVPTLIVPASAAPGSAVVTIPPNDKDASGQPVYNPDKPNGTFNLGGVTVTLGGFFDLTGYYRSRNENRGTSTSFSDIPFNGPTPQGDTSEFNLSAQQTRLSVRVDGKVSSDSAITGYVEADFNNGAGGANGVQSNSYTPRLRQAFVDYSNDPWQAYVQAGQAWNLATPFKQGLDPFQTWQPPTIDSSHIVGYDFLRVPLVRAVKGFGPAWFGIEIDAPQTVFGGSSVVPAGGAVYNSYAGNGGLNPQANYSVNSVPDLIGKAAVDTDFGHYEVFGVLRQFQDQVSYRSNAGNTAGTSNNFYSTGGGVGASVFISVTKYADLEGSILSGHGIGRYGAGGLPDVTYAANASLKPLNETMGEIGVVGHVLPTLDVYVLGGIDQIGKSYFGSNGGYGNPAFDNAGCFNPNASSGSPSGGGCAGNNYQLSEITVGYNWKIWTGAYGTVQTGLQYAYAKREAYGGNGGAPLAIENMVFANVRYIPFP